MRNIIHLDSSMKVVIVSINGDYRNGDATLLCLDSSERGADLNHRIEDRVEIFGVINGRCGGGSVVS